MFRFSREQFGRETGPWLATVSRTSFVPQHTYITSRSALSNASLRCLLECDGSELSWIGKEEKCSYFLAQMLCCLSDEICFFSRTCAAFMISSSLSGRSIFPCQGSGKSGSDDEEDVRLCCSKRELEAAPPPLTLPQRCRLASPAHKTGCCYRYFCCTSLSSAKSVTNKTVTSLFRDVGERVAFEGSVRTCHFYTVASDESRRKIKKSLNWSSTSPP